MTTNTPARRLRELTGETLTLHQPSMWKRLYEVRSGETVVGTMSLTGWLFNLEAKAESADGCWTIRTRGIWKQTLTVTPCSGEKPVFSLPLRVFSRTLLFKLAKYRSLTLRQNFWGTEYTLTSGMQQAVLTLKMKAFSFGGGTVTFGRKAEDFEELPWLLFVVYHKALQDQRSKSAAH